MGKPDQKRLVRKLDLELLLHRVKPPPSPKANLEQYTVSESVATTMLYLAAYTRDDIIGKKVLDLGCGSGRLALAASFLGAQLAVGVDIDKAAINIASENAERLGLKINVQWIISDISAISGKFDTVLQNPPFGVQKRAADRKFLTKALEVGRMVYSLHKHPRTDRQLIKKLKANAGSLLLVSPSPFIKKFVEDNNGTVEAVYAIMMTIPRIFDFHTKAKHEFVVDLYLIERND